MKIGIISFHNAQKELAPLQLVHLYEFLKQQGHDVEFINFRLKVLEKKKKAAVNDESEFVDAKTCEFIFTEEYNDYSELYNANLTYDILIAYGDQLWNPVYTKAVRSAYFLDFANRDALRIAYAVGTGEIPEYNKLQIQKYLRDFDAISVCDETSLHELQKLTGKSVQLLDVELNDERTTLSDEAQEFLNRALAISKQADYLSYFETQDVFSCYGCGTCKDLCPSNAITMEEDQEGFLYPVIDETRCLHCGKCKEACITVSKGLEKKQEENFPVVYAAYHKKEDIQKTSSCGGMFTPIYQHMLKKGGKVVGARFDENWNVIYDIADTESECKRFRGAKYVFADSKNIKVRVKDMLDKGTNILFSGTPCQIAGLKSYLGKDYENLYTVEIMCSGGGSPKIFRKYCEHLESVYKSKLVDFQFRNKFKHTGTPFVFVEFASGVCDVEVAKRNNLSKAFTSGTAMRPSCYTCKYIGVERGEADVTIGNYMGIKELYPDFAHPKGVSILKINTSKGMALFEGIKENLVLQESTYEDAYRNNQKKPKTLKGNRARLMQNIDNYPIDDLLLTFNPEKEGGIEGV